MMPFAEEVEVVLYALPPVQGYRISTVTREILDRKEVQSVGLPYRSNY